MSIAGTTASVNGSITVGPPPAGAISSRSPAPKLWIATTVPSAVPSAIDRGKSDQVGVVELVGLRRRQPVTRHEQVDVGQPLGGVAVGDALEPRDQVVLARPQGLDLEDARAVFASRAAP